MATNEEILAASTKAAEAAAAAIGGTFQPGVGFTSNTPNDPNAAHVYLSATPYNADGTPKGTTTNTVTQNGKVISSTVKPAPGVTTPASVYLGSSQSISLAKQYGLTGLGHDNDFIGLDPQEAADKAAALQANLKAQSSSANTTAAFNPATLSGAKKASDNFNLKIKDTMNDGWLSQGSKQDKASVIYDSSANDYAKLFSSQADFTNLYNTNPEFKANIDSYVKAGGSTNAILSKIQAPSTDPTAPNTQSTSDYLATSAPAGSSASDTAAYASLLPEREEDQAHIAELAAIPQQYKDMYFGTPTQTGILQQKIIEANKQKELLATKAMHDKADLRAQADLTVQQNNAEMDIEEATIEQNRLSAKNYITGELAKLGALNTTGAAPVAIATLEQKYQQQATALRTKTNFANQQVAVTLKSKINDIEDQRDSDILKVQTDLTKDKEDVLKEVFALNNTANKEIYSVTSSAEKDLRTQKEKYSKEATALATKNAKAFKAAASTYNTDGTAKMTTKQKAAALTKDVDDAVSQLQTIVKTKGFYGVSQDDYDTLAAYIQKEYGTAGVGKLRTAMGHVGLTIDKVGDGKGGI